MKFKEIITPFMEYKKDYVRMSTMNIYEGAFRIHIVPFFGEKTSITQNDVDEYLFLKAKEGLSKKTLEQHMIQMKVLLKWADLSGLFDYDVFKVNYHYSTCEKGSVDIRPLSVEDAKTLNQYCNENFNFVRLAIQTTLHTGLRVGEVCGLQFKDVDIENGTISVNKIITRESSYKLDSKRKTKISKLRIKEPKTANSRREIPLSKDVLHQYKILLKIVNPECYVATNSETPTEPRQMNIELKRILKTLGIEPIRFHDLRHTFATRCISSGIDEKTVSLLLGHSDVLTTLKLYTHVDHDSKKTAMDKLLKKMSW